MSIGRIIERFKTRDQRREYRAMLARWQADGGDRRFRFDYTLDVDSLAIDLGGYEGQWASGLYEKYGCRILVFEPVTRFADSLRERFAGNDDIEVFDYALGAATRTETIHLRGASSSTHKKRKAEKQEIRVVDVKQWFDEQAIDTVQLMKINIEGGEYELLERMLETGLTRLVDNIQVQFHSFASNAAARMAAIQAGLSATHTPTYQYRFLWENWARRRSDA